MSQTVVLLAEDEATIRMLVTMSLQREHISVLPATDADEALQVARNQERIDLLLTDVEMCAGSMNGIELAESILHDKPGTKVLVMSGGIRAARAWRQKRGWHSCRSHSPPQA